MTMHHHTAFTDWEQSFEHQYIALRKKEGRIYTDEEVLQLPQVTKTHPLWREWTIRHFSSEKLLRFLAQKKRKLNLLDIGCGNGWLSAKLSSLPGTTVIGLDVNGTELSQAKRVFQKQNLSFVYGDIRKNCLDKRFDVIVFAASFQYFEWTQEIIDCCLQQLTDGGEIHVIDTMFYTKEEMNIAAERSRRYFTSAGTPSMHRFYFHHGLEEFAGYNYKLLFDPNDWRNRLFKQSPFPWICIKK